MFAAVGSIRGRGALVNQLGARRPARFLFISDRAARSSWHDVPIGDERVAWRLVAGNNRAIGRSADVFASLAIAVAATQTVRDCVDRLVGMVTHDQANGNWRWTVSLGRDVLSVCVNAYMRRLECERALAQFLTSVRTAALDSIDAAELHQLGPGALRAYRVDVVSGGSRV
jgi:hypothetical protein